MGLLDFYRSPKPEKHRDVDDDGEDAPEPLPRISVSELWPPSPRVKILYIGLGFFLFNLLLLCIWAVVLSANMG